MECIMDRNIEYILEVARCGGITRAAENLFITPSALSKYVITLEAQLQVKLFQRVGKKFVPTKAGEYYIQKCLEIESIYHEMGQQMESISCANRGILRLGVQPNLVECVLRYVLPGLKQSLPGIRISIHETNGDSLIAMLKSQNLDVVIAIVGDREKGLDYKKIHTCEAVLAVGAGHPLRQKAEYKEGFSYPWVSLTDCEKERNVMLMPGSSFRRLADNLYASYGLTPNITYQFEATRTGLVCVAYNGAVMLTTDHMIFNSFQDDLVVPLSVGLSPVYRELCVVSSKSNQMQKETECLCGLVRQYLK